MRYATGELEYVVDDLSFVGFGLKWGHTRSYGNRFLESSTGVFGHGWFVKQLPALVDGAGGLLGMVDLVENTKWFSPGVSGTYDPLFALKDNLTTTGSGDYEVTDSTGAKTLFYGDANPLFTGKFKGYIDPAGHQYLATYDSVANLLAYTMSEETGGTAQYIYSYYPTGVSGTQLASVLCQINGVNVRRCTYGYYSAGEAGGTPGDLQTAVVEQFVPEGSVWINISTSYYQYYHEGEEHGFGSGLKFIVGPEAYARMVAANVAPEIASQAELAAYADYYFEYDARRRVSRETVDGGSLTSVFVYSESAFSGDANVWVTKTVETLSDGNQNIVYTNAGGQVMLKVFASGADQWFTYFRYDDAGRGILKAESSAVASYSESSPGLVTLNVGSGFVHEYQYYSDLEPVAPGYFFRELVREGEAGALTLLKELTYEARTVGPDSIYPLSTGAVYQSSAGSGSDPRAPFVRLHLVFGHVPDGSEDDDPADHHRGPERVGHRELPRGGLRRVWPADLAPGRKRCHHLHRLRHSHRRPEATH